MISLHNISKTITDGRRKQRIVDDVSLSIDKGEFVAIVGPSGSGKSTLLNIMGLLDRPTRGEYQFGSTAVLRMSRGRMATFRNRKIGFVFQSFMLMPRMTVRQNVELPLLYAPVGRGERIDLARESLDQVGMLSKEKRTAINLSGGEKQRVAIARALVNNPELILADEPTGNLDEKSKSDVLSIFLQLKKFGRTIVMVTHDMEAAAIADKIYTIRAGKLSEHLGSDPEALAIHETGAAMEPDVDSEDEWEGGANA